MSETELEEELSDQHYHKGQQQISNPDLSSDLRVLIKQGLKLDSAFSRCTRLHGEICLC